MADPTQQRLSVINEAFLGLKQSQIQAFDDELDGVDDIERTYLTTVQSVLVHPAFPSSVQRVALARQASVVDLPYNYTSPIGGDILAIYRDATTQTPYTQFSIKGGKVNTDLEQAWADVLVGAEPDAWPPYMRAMIVACLKADFCYAMTGDAALARDLRQIAYGGPGEFPDGGLVGAARRRASQQQGGGLLVMGENDLTLARYR